MNVVTALDRLASFRDISRPSLETATVEVTEKYARKRLKLKKDDPLIYKGLKLRCIGSKRWRMENRT